MNMKCGSWRLTYAKQRSPNSAGILRKTRSRSVHHAVDTKFTVRSPACSLSASVLKRFCRELRPSRATFSPANKRRVHTIPRKIKTALAESIYTVNAVLMTM